MYWFFSKEVSWSFLSVNFAGDLKISPIIVVSEANLEDNFFQIKKLNFSDHFIILLANHTLVNDLIVDYYMRRLFYDCILRIEKNFSRLLRIIAFCFFFLNKDKNRSHK